MALRAGDVAKSVAALLNDQGLYNNGTPTVFTFTTILPYLNTALGELRETLENYNLAYSNKTDTSIVVTAGTTEITLADLPSDFVDVRKLWERTNGQTNEDFIGMTKKDYLPPYATPLTFLIYYTFNNQKFEFIGATSDINLRLDYIATTMPNVLDETDPIGFINAQTFLEFRTAALVAEFTGENDTRADKLNSSAQLAYDRFLQIGTKARQSTAVRRRPFLRNYRNRGWA